MADFTRMTLGQIRARCLELEGELRTKAREHREARSALQDRERELHAAVDETDPGTLSAALAALRPLP